ncbi:N-acetylneuraminate synthase [Labilibaculum filiforme]|uniref:N-acetylneuraminate synthase n=1 Tax=Labilibaculum filiforme TaxID=1940526 RepID=A0A2N3I2D2_9BACT|nr:N-acetylneuraminate synthase family protein [Labilibaculum filiforme]PKQ64413.1 N-acetylneuraminate synthase [Labilibaculum filiforme]
MKSIKLGNRLIDDNSLYFIADIGANHNGSLEKAKALIHLAKESGADAAKFQNFSAKQIVSKQGFNAMKGKVSHQSKWKKSVFEIYEDASINKDWTKILKEECTKVGIDYFTSAYDFESVDLVDPFVDFYKIGSGDASWTEIIEYILDKKKPTIFATGACDWNDVERMMNLAKSKSQDVVLMQCNTNYTGSFENFKYCNLNVLKAYAERYPGVVLGLSDHTPGHSTVLGSIALGARIIEKHFTDDNSQEGPDHAFAMNPHSWKEMIERSYELLFALGDGEKRVEDNERQSYIVQRRCLCAKMDLKKGHRITKDDVFPLRPIGVGSFQPYEIDEIIGKELVFDLEEGCSFNITNIK